MKNNIQEIAYILQNKFLDEHFIVQRYDAKTTRSVYLKLDYGYANSIRISDHRGYDHLSYRYNVVIGLDKSYYKKDKKGFMRYYFTPDDIDKLIDHVLVMRKNRIKEYGESKYSFYVQGYYNKYYDTQGFWKNCKQLRRFNTNGTKSTSE